jgi:hypothetical protein
VVLTLICRIFLQIPSDISTAKNVAKSPAADDEKKRLDDLAEQTRKVVDQLSGPQALGMFATICVLLRLLQ